MEHHLFKEASNMPKPDLNVQIKTYYGNLCSGNMLVW
jgi:hypothetical protein